MYTKSIHKIDFFVKKNTIFITTTHRSMVMKYFIGILLFISPIVWGNELVNFEFKDNSKTWVQNLEKNYIQDGCTVRKNILDISEKSIFFIESTCDSGFFSKRSPQMSFSYKYETIQTNDFGMLMNYQSFSFGLTFDTKTYQNGDQEFVVHRPKINASYKGMFHFGKYKIHHKVTARWINPNKLMNFDENIFPALPLMDSRSELSSRVVYVGWHWKF